MPGSKVSVPLLTAMLFNGVVALVVPLIVAVPVALFMVSVPVGGVPPEAMV